ncbi:uncharacterized protein LOC121738824 isoform X2 [Aricia agestis]|uniref:uncharacterized protein LOC121738824 isoform X2 n=1 Tax=Aricia agestis TaxID=91739 RepID=UPI001C206B50|nr:uncharacterized protein LOC121738824 isoform X2 [Aricia agestis]
MSINMSGRLLIWDYFSKVQGDGKRAICDQCSKEFSYRTSITNLKTHLKVKHRELYNTFIAEYQQQQVEAALSSNKKVLDPKEKSDEDSDDPLCQETEEDDKGNIYLIPIKNEQLKTPSAKRQRRSLPTQKFEESSTIDMHEISQAYTINNPHEEDDCDRYVKILANKLRKLPEDERIIIMHEIDGLFVKRIQNKFNSSEA